MRRRLRCTDGGSAVMGGLTLLWVVGALVGLARIAVGWTRLAALFRSACPLDPLRHGPTLERVRDALGVAALPPVVTSPAVRAPVAVGLLRPRVILPEGLAESLTSDSLRDVLVHECAHVVRLDAWVGTAAAPGGRRSSGRTRWFTTRTVSSRGLARRFVTTTCSGAAIPAVTPAPCWP